MLEQKKLTAQGPAAKGSLNCTVALNGTVWAVLKLDPNDEDALKCKAYLLLETSKFAEASELLQQEKLQASLAFERVLTFLLSSLPLLMCGLQLYSLV